MPKINDQDALIIYNRIKDGELPSKVAREMGYDGRRVSDITKNRSHKHLMLEPLKTINTTYLNRGKSLADRLSEGLIRNNGTGCLEWQRHLHRDGYGMIGATGWKPETDLTHRVAWRLAHGEIPEGMCVLHKCDNPKCCNLDHLFLGNHSLNMHDMKMKQRSTRGTDKHTHKLTEGDVLDIVKRIQAGEQMLDIAKDYNVSPTAISNIKTGTTWYHITGIPHKPRLGSYLRPR